MYNHFRLLVEHCLHVSLLGSLISLILCLNLTIATTKRLKALYIVINYFIVAKVDREVQSQEEIFLMSDSLPRVMLCLGDLLFKIFYYNRMYFNDIVK